MNMNKIFEEIAMQNNMSVVQIYKDIQEALDYGWNNTDEKVQMHWHKIPAKHGKPTIEEVILYIVNNIK